MNVLILAGGRNSRIQTKKALLSVAGRPIIERIVARLRPVATGFTVVTGDPEAFAFTGLSCTGDLYPGKGPLGGLHAGLSASSAPLNLAVACDMPFVSADLAGWLQDTAEAHPEAMMVVPVWEKGAEPLFAVYRREIAALFEARLRSGDLRLSALLQADGVLQVSVNEWATAHGVSLQQVFMNVNTWPEWRKAEELARSEIASTRPPVFAVSGWQDSGKTRLVSRLVEAFTRTGLRVAVIKHDPHGHETDLPGKDTYVHRQAGAAVTVLAGPALVTTWSRPEHPAGLKEIVAGLHGIDVVIAEGWKGEPVPRVEVRRAGFGEGPLTEVPGADLLALVAEEAPPAGPDAASAVKPAWYHPDDVAGLAAFLRDRLGLGIDEVAW